MTIASLNPVELIGYLAALLVFSTFYMKTMIPLRSVAIASNLAFITYGYLAGCILSSSCIRDIAEDLGRAEKEWKSCR